MIEKLRLNIKNTIGWKSKRKIVAFSVDDYGNVRLSSKKARENLDKVGAKIYNHFDQYDSLETTEDLEILYKTLSSVKDKNGKHPIFTALALPCNLDFEKIIDSNYSQFFYEELPQTFSKLKGYENTWNLWKEGIQNRFLMPQFHGREHINLKIFNEKLAEKDVITLTAINNRSYTSIDNTKYPTISTAAAFDFWEFKENLEFENIIEDGINLFYKNFGSKPTYFTPPAAAEHPCLHKKLSKMGIEYIDSPLVKKYHLGLGKYKTTINYTGKKNKLGQTYIVRNCFFEPSSRRDIDWVNFTLRQIKAAFTWNKPAIISSHRVNFSGHIDKNNRKNGIDNLNKLLKEIVEKWPDVEFMSTNELGDLIVNKENYI